MMENNQSERNLEKKRLEKTITLAKKQLEQAKQANEDNKSAILSAKQELRENTSHSIASLWGGEAFEALIELNQYAETVTSKVEDYEAVASKIALLENLIKSPYFARIDFKFDDEKEYEQIYIGRASLKKDNSYDLDVYDWRSPIASVFYRFVSGPAFYDAPAGRITGEVGLKRQYEINNSLLEYFFDAEVHIVDEFLRKLLSQNTSTKMKAIVETIQKEQDIVIRDMDTHLMMVQGVAGSGKTSIALHRAAYLMYQGLSAKLAADNIIIISPNPLFEQYISNVLPELGEDNVVSVVFEEMLTAILGTKRIQSRNQFLEKLITSSRYQSLIKTSMEFKSSHTFMEILNRFIDDLPHRFIDFADINYDGQCIISKEAIKNRIITKNQETLLSLRLRQLEGLILELAHETKPGRIRKSEIARIKQEIQTFTRLSIDTLYRRLFQDKEYFYKLAEGLSLPDNIEDILTFTQENLCAPFFYYDDATALAFLTIKVKGNKRYKNIKQVVIDEAQDYYPLHYEIFKLLFNNAKYTILGDINQTLEKQEDLTLYQQIEKILNKKKSSLVTMDKSFRCTNEILNYSGKFIQQSLEIKSFNRQGDKPETFTANTPLALQKLIQSEISHCYEQGYQSIGLICKNEKNARALYQLLKQNIDLQLISNDSTTDLNGAFIIPVYMSKGLEFDAVLICDADADNYSTEDDKKLLYIACTRALHRLNLFCLNQISPLL